MKYIIAIVLIMGANAHAFDGESCNKSFRNASTNAYQMSIGELDELALCANELKEAKIQQGISAEQLRAFERLNSRTVIKERPILKDAE